MKEKNWPIQPPNPSDTVKILKEQQVYQSCSNFSVKWKINRRKAEIPSKFDYSHMRVRIETRVIALTEEVEKEKYPKNGDNLYKLNAKDDYVFTDLLLEVEPPYIEDGISKCLKEDIDSLI